MESSTRSTNRSFKKLITEQKASPEQIYATICNQTVDLVFTAHPTQAMLHSCLLDMHRYTPLTDSGPSVWSLAEMWCVHCRRCGSLCSRSTV